jgi:MFS family permease
VADREKKWVAVVASLVHGNIHALEHIFPVVLPLLLVDFDGSVALFGAVGTAAYLTMGLGGLPAGYLADRLGSKRSILMGKGLCVAGCVLVALSPGAGMVAGSLALLGVGLGLYHPAGLSLLSRTYDSFHGWSLGIHGVGGAAAIVVGPALFGMVAGLGGWRVAYVVAAVVSAALFVAVLVVPEPVREGVGERKVEGGVARWPLVVVILLETACVGLVYRGVVTFLPMYYAQEVAAVLPAWMTDALGSISVRKGAAAMDTAVGGTLASVTYASAVLGQTMGGWAASSRRFALWLLLIGVVFTGSLVTMGLGSGAMVLGAGILFAAFYFAAQPITNMMVARYTRGARHGIMYGVYFTAGFGVGSLAPLIAGSLVGEGSLSRVFLIMAVMGAAAVGLRAVLLKMVWRDATMTRPAKTQGPEEVD